MTMTLKYIQQWKKVCCCSDMYQDPEEKIYKHMSAVSKNVCIDTVDEIVDKYNETSMINQYETTWCKVDTYFDYGVEHNDKDPLVILWGWCE